VRIKTGTRRAKKGDKGKHQFPNPAYIIDEYMGLVKVKPDDPYIRRFQPLIDEYQIIFIDFKTDEYNLNIFINTDEFKDTDE
jgi:hypothetical protein